MPLGEDQMVVVRIPRVVEIVAQVTRQQHRHQVGRRHGRGRMARARGGGAADTVHAELLGQLANLGVESHRRGRTHRGLLLSGTGPHPPKSSVPALAPGRMTHLADGAARPWPWPPDRIVSATDLLPARRRPPSSQPPPGREVPRTLAGCRPPIVHRYAVSAPPRDPRRAVRGRTSTLSPIYGSVLAVANAEQITSHDRLARRHGLC